MEYLYLYPGLLVVTGGIAFLLVQGILRFRKYLWSKGISSDSKWLDSFVGCTAVIAVLLFVGTAFSPAYYEFPDSPDRLYSVEDGELVERPWGAFEFGNQLAWAISPKRGFSTRSSVETITENPKIRTISYAVIGFVADTQMFLAKEDRRHLDIIHNSARGINSVSESVIKLVKFCQYEFNNSFSKKLARFYNPLDMQQVRVFNALVEGYFNQCLKPHGVGARANSFSVS